MSLPTCQSCPKRSQCSEICDELSAQLPKEDISTWSEIPINPGLIESINSAPERSEERPLSWEWANIADSVRPLLKQAIQNSLTSPQKEVLFLLLDGYSQAQVARRLGVQRVTIHILLKRAKIALLAWFGGQRVQWRDKKSYRPQSMCSVSVVSGDHVLELFPSMIAPLSQTNHCAV